MKYQLKSDEYSCLVEACRRFSRFGHDYSNDIEKAWTGLGFKTEYKQACNNGYMEPVHSMPRNRCMGWWKLTEKGVKIVQHWLDSGYDFETIENGKCPGLPPHKS